MLKTNSRLALVGGLIVLILAGCNGTPLGGLSDSTILVPERMRTPDWPGAEIDSVAVWRGDEDRNWIFVTGKTSNLVYVCDAVSGETLQTIGSGEIDDATLRRPNGILVVDDLLYVVERDNQRVQVFSLPELKSVGTFGKDRLIYPYGIAARSLPSHHEVFITDNFDAFDDQGNPVSLDGRIKKFRVTASEGIVHATHELSFGAEAGTDQLIEVESILADPTSDRLYVCDEPGNVVRVYDSSGKDLKETIGEGTIRYEPEGMVFIENTELNPEGVLVITDQGEDQTILRIFSPDGKEYLGSFTGDPVLANTDGICFIPESFGPFVKGALFCVHDDLRVQGYSWGDVEKGLTAKE
ncbi:MAG: hypothetical protein KC964_22555 [Candidatus Omnitrophica bacterium]|nr:hypothetical protein [Candidatus Omnitrophota bacterium]